LGILAALRPSTAPPNRTGTITATLPHVTQAAAGTRTLPPGSGPIDQTLPHLTQDLAGSFTSGTGTATLTWGVAGAINSTSFIASSKTVGAASVRVKVATNSGMSTGVLFGGSGTVDGSNWGKSTVTGMTPGTSYWWQMEMTDGSAGVTLSTVAGPVKTAVTAGTPEATTDIGFGSCLESGSTNSVFSRISARSPHLFFHLGDFHYGDNSSTVQSSHLADVEGQFSANSSLRTILRNVPTYAIKSDHDAGGGNNAMPGTYTAPNRAAYKQVFPHPTLSDTNALYWSFVRGRVKFIFTDHRYIRTSTSMMGGATQEAWFKAELQTPEPVKIWVQDGVWTTVETPVGGGDKWSDYPTNHAAIGSWIAANAVGRVVTIHGDQHGLSADDGSNDTRAGIRAMCAAPFDKASSQKGGPWSQGVYPASGTTVVRQHGILHITDTGSVITLAYTGYDSADTSRVTLTTVVNTFAGAAGQTLPHLTQAATGTRSLPAFTGAAAQTLPHVTQAATGTRTIPPRTGTIAQSLPHLTQAATGTRTVPAFTGAAAQALPHVTQAAAGAVTNTNRTGTISQTLPHLTQAAVGTRTVPSGSIVQTLPHVTQAAAGTRTVPAFTGTAGQTLPHLTQALVGTRGLPSGRTGTITITLPHVTQSATGTRSLPGRVGTITQLLPRVTQQARSSVLIVRVREFTGRVVFGRGWSGRIR
jgi:hypothetical protein